MMPSGSLKALLVGLASGLIAATAICVPLYLIGLRDQFVFNVIAGVVGIVAMQRSCDKYMRQP